MFFRRTIGAALTAAAVLGTVAIVRSIMEEEKTEEEAADDSVNFINLDNGDETEEEFAPEIVEIAKLYPYLDKHFIAEQFARNGAFNKEYPEDTLITISHKAKFADPHTMQDYVKISEENGYVSEELSETENVIVKKMFTTEEAILSDIYNVSNQVACLGGTYEGYKIEK